MWGKVVTRQYLNWPPSNLEKLSKTLVGEIKSEVSTSQGWSGCCVFCYTPVSASFMAKNILWELRSTASSHPLVHESIRDRKITWRDKSRVPPSAGSCTTRVFLCCYTPAALPPKTHLSRHSREWKMAYIRVIMSYCLKYEKNVYFSLFTGCFLLTV